MSFGYSFSDAVLLTQLAWDTFQNARKACGEYDELTQQVSALHVVLRRFQQEFSVNEGRGQSENPDHERQGIYDNEIQPIVGGCEKVLGTLDRILMKYNGLNERKQGGSPKMLWKKVRFGNGEMADLDELRGKVIYYASLLTLFLNMRSTRSIGRVEQQMNNTGGLLRDIKGIVNGIAALQLSQTHQEGSMLSAYTNDDRSAWKDIRRELRHNHGFKDAELRKCKAMIIDYITELGHRGVLDDRPLNEDKEVMENVESVDRAAVQADRAADDQSKALRDTDDKDLKQDTNIASHVTFEDDACDGEPILMGHGDENLPASFLELRNKFDKDYAPLCLEFLNAPPKDEESSVERNKLLSDGILTDILIELGPINPESNDSSNNPEAQIHNFSYQVQQWLAKLDEAARENTTEWLVQLGDRLYNGLVVHFINTSVRRDSDRIRREEAYALMRKKISQELILLGDIEVDGSPGLRIMKAYLQIDLKAMQKAIETVQKKSNWQWKDLRQYFSLAPTQRVVLLIHDNIIITRYVMSIQIVRAPSLIQSREEQTTQDACISCRRVYGFKYEKCFPCDHTWCFYCVYLLVDLAIIDRDFEHPTCCNNGLLDSSRTRRYLMNKKYQSKLSEYHGTSASPLFRS